MNILMMTNTFTPHRGGVARSVEAFTAEFRARGHRVLVVAPAFEDMPMDEHDVVRIPAIQNFNGSDFSVVLPISALLHTALDEFDPDIVHSHHPFLLGTMAIRVAATRARPLVFTHHTMYEHYTHYVPGDSPILKRFVIDLATNYANLCAQVIAPSESTEAVLRSRGVTAPIDVASTGVSIDRLSSGDGESCRQANRIPQDAFVVGHVGRLAAEKNLAFLAEAVARFLDQRPQARFLVVGSGDAEADIRRIIGDAGHNNRLHCLGSLGHPALADAYDAMDVFAFASTSETQGMVLTEAMAAGVPVVALDAPGAREVVDDGINGRLLPDADAAAFAAALAAIERATPAERHRLTAAARTTADSFSIGRSAEKILSIYQHVLGTQPARNDEPCDTWNTALRLIEAEWHVLAGLAEAAGTALVQGAQSDDGAQ